MSRGFQLANVDVGILQDPKMIKLAKYVPDEGERAYTELIYFQTMLESWRVGERVTALEAEILWEPTDGRVAALQKVGLLTDDGRVTESAWATYYGAALERSERRRTAGKKGGLASGRRRKQSSTSASASLQQSSSGASAKPNLTPADPPSPEGEAGGGRAGLRVMDAPARPPVHMNHLDEADTAAIETMLRNLSAGDGRRRQLQAELESRRTADRQRSDSRAGARG